MDQYESETELHSQYLTFQSGGKEYAINILRAKEIIPFKGASPVPMVPPAIRGLINLRGAAVPVVDLAVKFDLPETSLTNRTCVLVIDLKVENEMVLMGLLAEAVKQVISIAPDEIEITPEFGTGQSSAFISGLAKVEEDFIPILDVDNVLRPSEALQAIIPEL